MTLTFRTLLTAAAAAFSLSAAAAQDISLSVGEGRDLAMPEGASSVLVADPDVADAQATSPTSIFVTGVAPGRTNIIVRDPDSQPIRQFNVRVRRGSGTGGRSLGRNINLTETDDGAILTGRATDVTEAQSISGARRVLNEQGLSVQDRTTYAGPNQVSLRVRFVEASRNDLRRVGLNVAGLGDTSAGPIRVTGLGDPTGFLAGGQFNSPAVGARASVGGVSFDTLLEALEQRGVVQILSEPTLTTVDGQTASFRAGGEFAYPVNQGDGVISAEFKDYGVAIDFTPTILPGNRIALHVAPEVSFVDESSGTAVKGFNVPGLSVRRADTTVEVASGQTFAIAGLYEQYSSQAGSGVPGLSQVLGRNQRKRQERELMIFITPYLASPSDAVAKRPQRRAPASSVGFITR